MSEKREGEDAQQNWICPPDEAELLWDEYKYRHEHCWKTIFQLTSASVLLGVVPYLDAKLPKVLAYWLLAPPILSVALIGFAMFRMRRELYLLRQVKSLHRDRQKCLYHFRHDGPKGTFDKHVWWYLAVLLLLAIMNVIAGALYLYWTSQNAF